VPPPPPVEQPVDEPSDHRFRVHGAPRVMLHRRPVERWARAGATATDTTQVTGATDSARSFGRPNGATVGPLTRSSEPPIHRIADPTADQLGVGRSG